MRRPNNLGDVFPFEECNRCHQSIPYIIDNLSFEDNGVEYVIKCKHEYACKYAFSCGVDYAQKVNKE